MGQIDPYWLLLIPLALVLVFGMRWRMREDRKDNAVLSSSWTQLNDEVLAVSLLVSKNCPDNAEAHSAVIEAAQCLVYPKPNNQRIIGAGDIQRRYQEGFAHAARARQLAGGAPKA